MIDSTIYTNGRGEVTAQNINLAMHGMVDATEEKFSEVEQTVTALGERVEGIAENGTGGSGVVTFYTTNTGELSEEQKAKNVAAFNKYAAGIADSVIVPAEGKDATYYPFVASYIENDGGASGLSFLACNFPIKMPNGNFAAMLFYEDGSVVMQME
jgi:hypothetical protein